ncbi:cobalamin-dependent protein [Gemmatimonadota bacterium]
MNETSSGLLLTSTKVADLLGVHSSTVKRWCDEGALLSERTDGGHRRIRLGDALDTGRSHGISTFLDFFHPWEVNVCLAVTDVEERKDFRRLHNLALGWLSSGNTDLMGRLLFEVGSRSTVPFPLFLDEGLRAFMAQVGEEWQGGRLAVGEEHMASQVVLEVLLRLRTGWDHPLSPGHWTNDPPPVAVVGAMEGDHHDLGAHSIRVLLEREGWRVYYLGADVPLEDFADIQRAQGASLVCVSLSPKNGLRDLQRVVRVLGEFYRPGHPYALGLGGSLGTISEEMVPDGPFDAVSISKSAQEFLTWVRALQKDGDTQDPRSLT